MTLKELMERAGTTNQGFAIAYLKDAMREINMMIEDNVVNSRADIAKDQRYYSFPANFAYFARGVFLPLRFLPLFIQRRQNAKSEKLKDRSD